MHCLSHNSNKNRQGKKKKKKVLTFLAFLYCPSPYEIAPPQELARKATHWSTSHNSKIGRDWFWQLEWKMHLSVSSWPIQNQVNSTWNSSLSNVFVRWDSCQFNLIGRAEKCDSSIIDSWVDQTSLPQGWQHPPKGGDDGWGSNSINCLILVEPLTLPDTPACTHSGQTSLWLSTPWK